MAIETVADLKAEYPELVERIEKDARGEEHVSSVVIVKNKEGRVATWTEELKDLDGKLISKREDGYTYYAGGQVNTITQKRFDAAEKLIGDRDIKHPEGGGEPVVTVKS